MFSTEAITFGLYFLILITVVFLSYQSQKSDTQYVLGNRSLNFYLTALSAHASDMSNWLFMGYPALVFAVGIFSSWAAIGLIIFMFLNWQFVAPKIRAKTEKANDLTLNSYFESYYDHYFPGLRLLSSFITLVFFTVYISAGLIGFGFLIESLFGLDYSIGISLGLLVVAFYVLLGGYITVAWIDLFQGLFLLFVILLIPFFLLVKLKNGDILMSAIHAKEIFLPFSWRGIFNAFLLACGWGLGYFGQPHILTKFMGIKNIREISKAKYLGISWQGLALLGATLFGLMGIFFFPQGLKEPEVVVLKIVRSHLSPFFSALILCAILAATTNVIAAQILIVASSLAEDIYKRFLNKKATHKKVLKISRFSVIVIVLISYLIALFRISTIYNLVLYAWSGIGASFGPLVLATLHFKGISKKGAISAVLAGALTSGIWPFLRTDIPPLIPAFLISFSIIFVDLLEKKLFKKL